MREVLAARKPSVVYASSMSSSGGPMWPICHTWSITDSFAKPASSAVCATRFRSSAILLGPSDHVNFDTCTPSCIKATLTTARTQHCGPPPDGDGPQCVAVLVVRPLLGNGHCLAERARGVQRARGHGDVQRDRALLRELVVRGELALRRRGERRDLHELARNARGDVPGAARSNRSDPAADVV